MCNELIKTENSMPDVLEELRNTESVVKALMASKHYAKMGADGVLAIVNKAKSMGIPVLDALNGGLYYVQGKTEMSAQMMNRLIRSKGHSIQKDPKSTNELCILHGKRADNKDTWTVSFSVEDAKRAGIYKDASPWGKYPSVMCFNRALSMLARQLFPDIIIDSYVEGEISGSPGLHEVVKKYISEEQLEQLQDLIVQDVDPCEVADTIKKRLKIEALEEIELDRFNPIISWMKKRLEEECESVEVEVVNRGEGE